MDSFGDKDLLGSTGSLFCVMKLLYNTEIAAGGFRFYFSESESRLGRWTQIHIDSSYRKLQTRIEGCY